eukprot:TRINITY_DN21090_c0_g1_i1.p1 TRINITY_DN21090_c0_g1~~TRINITY_DN21090_c0_g1_i1.p1  ORF type:complete len:378 (+),score=28.99 TRINITY_DN21090_c0_g1_i1:370-1503(+)
MNAGDEDALLSMASVSLDCDARGDKICDCRSIICWVFQSTHEQSGSCAPRELRIVGLVFPVSVPWTGSREQVRDMNRFQHLLFWDVYVGDGVKALPDLDQLRTMRLRYMGSVVLPAKMPSRLRWLSIEPGRPTDPNSISAICSLRELQSLRIQQLRELPVCIGMLSELLALDVRNGYLQKLPQELEQLSKLVEFVAFEQSHIELDEGECLEDMTCVPSFESMLDPDEPGKYRCNAGWSQDLTALPVFKWRHLEKFWVDANSLWASPGFFAQMAESWPNLRTLDLYDNNIRSDASELVALMRLPLLHQVLLQSNQLVGTFPGEVVASASALITMFLSFNKDLHGCIPPMKGSKFPAVIAAGTQIRVSGECNRSKQDEL